MNKQKALNFMIPPIVVGMILAFESAAHEAHAKIAAEISRVGYGPPGIIKFIFRGKVYQIPEPMDVMLVDSNPKAAALWISRHHFEMLVAQPRRKQ